MKLSLGSLWLWTSWGKPPPCCQVETKALSYGWQYLIFSPQGCAQFSFRFKFSCDGRTDLTYLLHTAADPFWLRLEAPPAQVRSIS